MPRLYHSPSSIDLGRRCEFAWALCYIAKLREAEIDYRDIEAKRIKAVFDPKGPGECSYKQRGASLGTAGHQTYEQHWMYGKPDWSWYPGVVAQSGLHLWPHREDCIEIEAEHEIGDVSLEQDDPKKPQRAMRIGRILLAGKRDIALQTVSEWGEPWLLGDYKFTSNIVKYAKTADALRNDVAANAYALDMMHCHGLSIVDCRWVYHETKEIRRAVPIDFVISEQHALDILQEAATFAAHLDTIVAPIDAHQNTNSCCDFSGRPGEIGCSYHVTKGGPCTARPGLGQLIQARVKEKRETNMPTAEELRAKLANAKTGAKPAEATVETAVEVSAPATETAPAATKPRGRPARATVPVSPGVEALQAKVTEIATLQAEADVAAAKVATAKQELAALCL